MCRIKADWDTLQIFMKSRVSALFPMAGLDRKVYLRIPEDYKGVGALKSCIYRSFITSLWCGFFIEAMARVWHQKPRAIAFFCKSCV